MDIGEALKTVLHYVEYKVKKYDIDLECHIERELRCIGNVSQIKEILYSVINNAIEAVINMKHRKVEIFVKENDHTISIYVRDTGKGIAESVRPFIFQPFFTTKGPQGLGIGLSLAKSLLQRHSGDITLVRPFNPTCFCISIPSP
jgi:signal transduction histidine kinase